MVEEEQKINGTFGTEIYESLKNGGSRSKNYWAKWRDISRERKDRIIRLLLISFIIFFQ